VIGYLTTFRPARFTKLAAFRQGLTKPSYVEEKRRRIEYRGLEEAIIGCRTGCSTSPTSGRRDLRRGRGLVAKGATSTIPSSLRLRDPVAAGWPPSRARRAQHQNGFSTSSPELMPKRLGAVGWFPSRREIRHLVNPTVRCRAPELDICRKRARKGVERISRPQRKARSTGPSARSFQLQAGGAPSSPPIRSSTAARKARRAGGTVCRPAIYEWREFAELLRLNSYGPSKRAFAPGRRSEDPEGSSGRQAVRSAVQRRQTFELVAISRPPKPRTTVPALDPRRADEVMRLRPRDALGRGGALARRSDGAVALCLLGVPARGGAGHIWRVRPAEHGARTRRRGLQSRAHRRGSGARRPQRAYPWASSERVTRYSAGHVDRLPALAGRLPRQASMSSSRSSAASVAGDAAAPRRRSIVMVLGVDPVADGFIAT